MLLLAKEGELSGDAEAVVEGGETGVAPRGETAVPTSQLDAYLSEMASFQMITEP